MDVDQPWFWYIFVAALLLYPWLWWTSLWFAIGRARAQFAGAELRLCVATATIVFVVVLAAGRQTADLLPLLPPVALIIARVWATDAGKARDFHAAVPGLLALFVCLFFFMLNIIPVAHLDAVWQRLFESDLPVWLGGISLASGITLLSGSYLLVTADAAHEPRPPGATRPAAGAAGAHRQSGIRGVPASVLRSRADGPEDPRSGGGRPAGRRLCALQRRVRFHRPPDGAAPGRR